MVSFSTALSSTPEKDHEVLEKDLKFLTTLQPTNKPKTQKITENKLFLGNHVDDVSQNNDLKTHLSSYPKNEQKSNLHKEKKEKKGRNVEKLIKENNRDDRQTELKSKNLPDISRLSEEIVNKVRKLMENEIREMNIMPQQRSKANHQSEGSSLSNSSLKAFQTFSTQFHSDDRNATKEKENLQLNETSNQTLFNSAAISEISQNQKVQEESESLVQKVLIEKVLDNKDKKESSSKSQINKKSSNGQISMMKLSRNGGIENNLSRKEIERPSWRSELLGNKYQPQDVKSSESKVYFQISSSLQESESNITKLVEKSEKLASLETHVQQSSEAPRGEIYDEKKELIDKTQSRTKEEIVEPREEDIIEAANFGMQAMNDLYYIKEPKLYSLGT